MFGFFSIRYTVNAGLPTAPSIEHRSAEWVAVYRPCRHEKHQPGPEPMARCGDGCRSKASRAFQRLTCPDCGQILYYGPGAIGQLRCAAAEHSPTPSSIGRPPEARP